MAKSALHILALRKQLLANKPYLKQLKTCKSTKKRIHLLKGATHNQLRTLQLLLVAFVQGEIAISSKLFKRLKRTRKLNYLIEHFSKAKFYQEIKEIILKLVTVLPLLLNVILKHSG